MKLGDMRKILESVERVYRDAGNMVAADSLQEISRLCEGRESMQVSAFAKLVAKAGAVHPGVGGR